MDESATAGFDMYAQTAGARRHDYIYVAPARRSATGLPVALGSAIACPQRKVWRYRPTAVEGTPTRHCGIVRKKCDIAIVILKNDEYAILNVELARVREGETTPGCNPMLDIDKPPSTGSARTGHGCAGGGGDQRRGFFSEFRKAP